MPVAPLQIDFVALRPFHANDEIEPPVAIHVGPSDVLMKSRVIETNLDARIGEPIAGALQDVAGNARVGLSDEDVHESVPVVIAPRGAP